MVRVTFIVSVLMLVCAFWGCSKSDDPPAAQLGNEIAGTKPQNAVTNSPSSENMTLDENVIRNFSKEIAELEKYTGRIPRDIKLSPDKKKALILDIRDRILIGGSNGIGFKVLIKEGEPLRAQHCCWSADSQWIFFTDRIGLHKIQSTGEGFISIHLSDYLSRPQSSLDGKWIAFSKGGGDVCLVTPDGSQFHQIASIRCVSWFEWLSGNKLAVLESASDRPIYHSYKIVNADTGGIEYEFSSLCPNDGLIISKSLSPDKKWFAFSIDRRQSSIMKADGRDSKLTIIKAEIITWSMDSQWIYGASMVYNDKTDKWSEIPVKIKISDVDRVQILLSDIEREYANLAEYLFTECSSDLWNTYLWKKPVKK